MADSKVSTIPNVLVVTDIGNDYDDLLALLILGYYHKLKKITLLGVIVTLAPALRRAQMAHGLLHCMGIDDVEVALGTEGTLETPRPVEAWTEEALTADFVTTNKEDFKDHKQLSREIFTKVKEKNQKIRFLSIACLRTSWEIVEQDEELFADVVDEVHCQGGCQWDLGSKPEKVLIARSNARNNLDDMGAANNFYQFARGRKIPCVSYEKEAPYACTFQKKIFNPENASQSMHQVATYIYKIHDRQKIIYYNQACSDNRYYNYMNREWFIKNSCLGLPKALANDANCPAEDILPYTTVVPYDPIAALGCIRDVTGIKVPLGPIQYSEPKKEVKPAQKPAQKQSVEFALASTPITIEERTDTVATTISKTDTLASSPTAFSTTSSASSPSMSPISSPKTLLPNAPATTPASAPATAPRPPEWYDPPRKAEWDQGEMALIATCKFVKKGDAADLAEGIQNHMGMALAMEVEQTPAAE